MVAWPVLTAISSGTSGPVNEKKFARIRWPPGAHQVAVAVRSPIAETTSRRVSLRNRTEKLETDLPVGISWVYSALKASQFLR